MSYCCLLSCTKTDPEVCIATDEHTYELIIPAEGITEVNFLDFCKNMSSSLTYEVAFEEDCDWVEFSTSDPDPVLKRVTPYITVKPNTTGATRSVEVTIQSSEVTSYIFYEKHLLVQDSL